MVVEMVSKRRQHGRKHGFRCTMQLGCTLKVVDHVVDWLGALACAVRGSLRGHNAWVLMAQPDFQGGEAYNQTQAPSGWFVFLFKGAPKTEER